MLRKTWYAVCREGEIVARTTPHQVIVHGEPLVLWADSQGNVSVHPAACPHRGCDLGLGRVESGELVCPFHGWRFDMEGRCVKVPANTVRQPVPSGARLKLYPTVRKWGWVWVYTENGYSTKVHGATVPSLLSFPEFEHKNWKYEWFEARWHAHFSRVVESVLDISHLPFVHPETTGQSVDPQVKGLSYQWEEANGQQSLRIYPRPFAPSHPLEPPVEWGREPNPTEGRTEMQLMFPNQWIIRTPMGDGHWMCTYLTFTPEDMQTTRIYGTVIRNFDPSLDWLTQLHLEHTKFVMEQDRRIVESLRPLIAPFEIQKEFHVPSDAPGLRYRSMLKQEWMKEQIATSEDERFS